MTLTMNLITKIKSWFTSNKVEIQEAERFEDWFHRLNPSCAVDPEIFNEFHKNLRKQTTNESKNHKNYKQHGGRRHHLRVA
jgi:hypothetical protein